MVFVQGYDRMSLPVAVGAGVDETRQPITLAMRLGHRLTASWWAKPRVLRNPAPLVSLTFDDVPDSAVTLGARILEAHGVHGTFYVSTGILGGRTPDWRLAGRPAIGRLAEAGHEVALHSHEHRPVAALTPGLFHSDLRQCAATLAGLMPRAPSDNFAYPFGFAHVMHGPMLNRTVRSSRTTHPGINAGRIDIHGLRSFAFGSTLHETAAVDALLDRTVACGGWLILTGHDVAERPSAYGCTPALLQHALDGAAARGITVAPVDRALDLCGVEPLAPQAFGR